MPGTRFIFKTTRALGGNTVHLRHKGPWLSNADTNAILGQVQTAKSMLSATIAAIYNGVIGSAKRHAATYFLIPNPPGPTAEQCRRIIEVLELAYNGLNSDVTLKLGADGGYGYVRQHHVPARTPGSFSAGDGTALTHEGRTIHISKKCMLRSADIGVITVIHEATHKYANTLDHGFPGYRNGDDSGWMEPGLTVDQALNNADSYAYFAFHVGRDCNC